MDTQTSQCHTIPPSDFARVRPLQTRSLCVANLDAPGVPHPRNYFSAVRVLGHYVRDEKVLTLEEAACAGPDWADALSPPANSAIPFSPDPKIPVSDQTGQAKVTPDGGVSPSRVA